jgi:hypothetical protein
VALSLLNRCGRTALTFDVLWSVRCGGRGRGRTGGLAGVEKPKPDHVRLSHPLYGEALRAAMGTVERRRGVMVRLADAMQDAAQASRALLLRVAVWRLEQDRGSKWLFTDAARSPTPCMTMPRPS